MKNNAWKWVSVLVRKDRESTRLREERKMGVEGRSVR
jgi:hypothetical protein